MCDIKELRKEIDKVDYELVKLFEKRMKIVEEVAKYKMKNNEPVLNTSREKEVIRKNLEHLEDKRLQLYLEEFLKDLMNISKEFQNKQITIIK